ncbi:MAG: hypothetical protein DIZ80_07695 [endosymbiont of Galathealinum brachiosum]|uniref:Carrier domain-containing protein n=1 Tax=endosymbiont of Galathealinum brachiosum TaxID=2200906 RepID=A0A370DGG5_9GAMM|nr:MAG: hypothetical protein DIZ80_07695 [endosymbiont of Galathealinum brachiosum]
MKDMNELGTVKALMSMSLYSIIEDIFDIDQSDIKLSFDLRSDLNMSNSQEALLADAIADYFDGIQPDLKEIQTLDNLFDMVVEKEFSHIPDEAFLM